MAWYPYALDLRGELRNRNPCPHNKAYHTMYDGVYIALLWTKACLFPPYALVLLKSNYSLKRVLSCFGQVRINKHMHSHIRDFSPKCNDKGISFFQHTQTLTIKNIKNP